jgi:site-specific recombinase XerD
MATLNYYVRAKKSETAPIFIRLSAGRGKDLIIKSGLVVDADRWSNKKQSVKLYTETNKSEEKLMHRLNDLREHIMGEYKELYGAPTKEWLSDAITQFFSPRTGKAKTLNDYITAFIAEAKKGKRNNKDAMNYSPGTVRSWAGFQRIFNEYQGVYTEDRFAEIRENGKNPRPVKKLDFDDIDLTFYERFKAFLTSEGYKPNTTGRFIKNLKYFMQKSLDEKLHNSRDFQNKSVFRGIAEDSFSVYLTEAELDKIYKKDLQQFPRMELARDAFIVLCETALRVSDYPKINFSIRKVGKVNLIYITQTKTGGEVVIPLSARLEEILNKYNGKLPRIPEQYINKYIKVISQWCEITEKLNWEVTKYGKRYRKSAYKWELITCHSGRRSAATNMFKAGIPILKIMSLTGHRTESSFLKYIKVTKEETAISLASHPYFRKTKLKIV